MKKEVINLIIVFILAAAMLLPALSAGAATRMFSGEEKTVYKGVTYFYKTVEGDNKTVVLTGVVVPEGTTELTIPERLAGKEVIYININEVYTEYFDDTDKRLDADDKRVNTIRSIRKLNLSSKIRPYDTGVYLWWFDNLESIQVDKENKFLKAKDGVLYDASMKSMLFYPLNKKSKKYKMPSSIEQAVMIKNKNLEKLTFSKNKKFINVWVGEGCKKLKSVYFPDNIKSIGGFDGCSRLTSIRWSRNTERIEGFSGCRSLSKVRLPDKLKEIGAIFQKCSGLRGVVLPKRLREIGTGAFSHCNKLNKISALPKTLEVIQEGAFEGSPCRKKLKKASYLMRLKGRNIRGKVQADESIEYLAVAEVTRGGKHMYYDSREVFGLKPSSEKIVLGTGKTKTVNVIPGIKIAGYKNGWKMKTNILKFTSSDPKVAKVTANGKIIGKKKGTAVITVKMRTSDVKRKIKVTVK